MQTIQQTVRLRSDENFGTRLPPEQLGHLLTELPQAVTQSIAMAVVHRSQVKGTKPGWLRRAADIRFTGHRNGDGISLDFETATLGEASAALFEQQTLFPDMVPDREATGLDLFASVLTDVSRGDDDSSQFDKSLLRRISRFGKVFKNDVYTGIEFPNRRNPDASIIELNPTLVESAKSMAGRTPIPQRVRLVGELDGIEASTRRFSLLLDTGDRVAGIFTDGQMDVMQRLWRNRVLVLGEAVYRASGRLLRIDADEVQPGDNEPSLFSRLPSARHDQLEKSKLKQRQGPRSGMAAIAGAWPGDETDEEIQAELERLS